jgi:hypothetical protein
MRPTLRIDFHPFDFDFGEKFDGFSLVSLPLGYQLG